jgi:hypothetical protein
VSRSAGGGTRGEERAQRGPNDAFYKGREGVTVPEDGNWRGLPLMATGEKLTMTFKVVGAKTSRINEEEEKQIAWH